MTTAPIGSPLAAKKPVERLHHNDLFVDDYEWLRDKESPEVLAHLEAENAYTDARTAGLAPLREQLFDEIKARTRETDLSVPVRQGQWWYYTRTVEGQEYGIHCRAPISGPDDWAPPILGPEAAGAEVAGAEAAGAEIGAGAAPVDAGTAGVEDDGTAASAAGPAGLPGEQVLLDDNAEAAGHDFYALGSFDVSADATRLLYAVDTEGDERYTIRVRDLTTGQNLADEITDTGEDALFEPSGRYLFYTTVDEAWRPDTVWRHEVGTESANDAQVFHEPDDRFWVGIGLTRSRKYLLIEAGSSVTTETRLLDTDDPTGDFAVVWTRRDGVEYDVEHAILDGEDRLLIVHNDHAINFELVDVAAADPHGPQRMLLPHDESVRLEGVDAFRDFVIAEYRRDGLTQVAIASLGTGTAASAAITDGTVAADSTDGTDATGPLTFTELAFDEPLFTAGTGANPEWEQPTIRFGYTSFVTPSTVYDLVVATGERRLLKQQTVLGEYDPARYEQRREWATAEDGTRVPISLVYRSDLVAAGEPAPTLLYGYGSYEISIDPTFSVSRLSLLDRGLVYAIAHVRGGGELGRLWYEHGKELEKRNSFTDFIACARHLIDAGITAPDRLVAEGRSAGGLLMGAVANLAPELFSGILAGVPFVDPLTSILDPSLPLTVIEWDEWGDPLHDAEVYAYIKSYSPVENVRDTPYPRILAVTSLNDTRVLFVEPAKWVAHLREVGADVLLKTEMSAGHGGVSGRYARWREIAFDNAWILDAAGAHPLP